MTPSEKVLIMTNRISKIISSMEIEDVNNPKSGDVNKEFVQKVLQQKLDLEEFLNKLKELKNENRNLLPLLSNNRNLIQITENNEKLIIENTERFEKLLEKINSMLEQLKLNKKLSNLM